MFKPSLFKKKADKTAKPIKKNMDDKEPPQMGMGKGISPSSEEFDNMMSSVSNKTPNKKKKSMFSRT